MSGLRFEEPPEPKRAPRRYEETVRALREAPGRWAVVASYPKSKRSNASSLTRLIRHGLTAAWSPCGDFEGVSRTVGDECRVYARYLGNGGEDE